MTTTLDIKFPHWVKIVVPYTAFTTAATAGNATLMVLPAGTNVHATKIKHSTSFSGGGLTAFIVYIGTATGAAKYGALDVFQTVADAAVSITDSIGNESDTVPTTLLISAASLSANINAATAGSVTVYLLLSETL